jgi:hypothetical protein
VIIRKGDRAKKRGNAVSFTDISDSNRVRVSYSLSVAKEILG